MCVCVWLYSTNKNLCEEMTHHGGSKEQIYCAFYQLTLVEFHLIEKSCLSSSICFGGEGGTTCKKILNQRQRQKKFNCSHIIYTYTTREPQQPYVPSPSMRMRNSWFFPSKRPQRVERVGPMVCYIVILGHSQ